MKKTLLLTLLASPLIFTSCGDKDQEANVESTVETSSSQLQFEELAEQELKSRITKFTTDLMLDTPSYLKLEGPTVSHSYNEAAGTLLTEMVWSWTSEEDFYRLDGTLTTEDQMIQVVELQSPKGRVAKHVAKAVCNVDAELEELSFVRLSSTPDSFTLNDYSLSSLGKPLSSFKTPVISGSEEHVAAVKRYKAHKDKLAADTHAEAQKKAEAEALARQKSINSMLATLQQDGSFTGVLEDDRKRRGSVKFDKATIREVAGEVVVSFKVWKVNAEGEIHRDYKPATFEGGFDDHGVLVLRNIKTGYIYSGTPHYYITWSQSKMTVSTSNHPDKLLIEVQRVNSDDSYVGSIVRQ